MNALTVLHSWPWAFKWILLQVRGWEFNDRICFVRLSRSKWIFAFAFFCSFLFTRSLIISHVRYYLVIFPLPLLNLNAFLSSELASNCTSYCSFNHHLWWPMKSCSGTACLFRGIKTDRSKMHLFRLRWCTQFNSLQTVKYIFMLLHVNLHCDNSGRPQKSWLAHNQSWINQFKPATSVCDVIWELYSVDCCLVFPVLYWKWQL